MMISPIQIGNFKDNYVPVFDLTSMQDATEFCDYPELVGEQLGLELTFNFPLEHVFELILLGEQMSSVTVDKVDVVGKNIEKGYCFSPANNQPYPTTQVSVSWLFFL